MEAGSDMKSTTTTKSKTGCESQVQCMGVACEVWLGHPQQDKSCLWPGTMACIDSHAQKTAPKQKGTTQDTDANVCSLRLPELVKGYFCLCRCFPDPLHDPLLQSAADSILNVAHAKHSYLGETGHVDIGPVTM